jgi:hypothetical protein
VHAVGLYFLRTLSLLTLTNELTGLNFTKARESFLRDVGRQVGLITSDRLPTLRRKTYDDSKPTYGGLVYFKSPQVIGVRLCPELSPYCNLYWRSHAHSCYGTARFIQRVIQIIFEQPNATQFLMLRFFLSLIAIVCTCIADYNRAAAPSNMAPTRLQLNDVTSRAWFSSCVATIHGHSKNFRMAG